jgi:hypothetical protein
VVFADLTHSSDFTPSSPTRSSTVGAVRNPHIPYADVLVTELSPEGVSQITEVFNRMGMSDWLEQNPFSSLEFSAKVFFDGREVGGLYDYEARMASVSLSKSPDEYGQEFVWGKISKVSAVSNTPEEEVTEL